MYKNLEDLPLILSVADIQDIFGIGQRQAYELVHIEGFPSMKVGHSIRVYKPQLIEWIKVQTEGQIL